MRRLTRAQLRAIFAKISQHRKERATYKKESKVWESVGTGPKNLGLTPPKGKRIKMREVGMERMAKPALTAEDVPRLIERLPSSHQKLSSVKDIQIGNAAQLIEAAKGPGAKITVRDASKWALKGGEYNGGTGVLRVNSAQSGFMGKHPGGYTRFPVPRHGSKNLERRAKVGSAAAFYHEYAHSLVFPKNFYYYSDRWKKISFKEWRPTASHRVNKQKLGAESEFWAEAYASYALSRVSRSRLKRERPETYKYMREFFESPDSFDIPGKKLVPEEWQ
jgi:hypothetical protein